MGSIIDAIGLLADALDEAHIPYGFGGALALAYYAPPRATTDIDIGAFVPPSNAPAVQAALAEVAEFPEDFTTTATADGFATISVLGVAVDCFFATNAIHQEIAAAITWVPFRNRQIPIISAEFLIVLKCLFDRSKDWTDIEAIVEGSPALDTTVVDAWLIRAGLAGARRRFRDVATRARPPAAMTQPRLPDLSALETPGNPVPKASGGGRHP